MAPTDSVMPVTSKSATGCFSKAEFTNCATMAPTRPDAAKTPIAEDRILVGKVSASSAFQPATEEAWNRLAESTIPPEKAEADGTRECNHRYGSQDHGCDDDSAAAHSIYQQGRNNVSGRLAPANIKAFKYGSPFLFRTPISLNRLTIQVTSP